MTAAYLLALLAVGTHIAPNTANLLFDNGFAVPSIVGETLVVVAAGGIVAGLPWVGDRLSQRLLRWRSPTTRESDRLDPAVRRLSMQFDITVLTIRVGETETPTGYTVAPFRGPATVVVTAGLLVTFPEAELSAVPAHGLAHVANRDTTVFSAVSTRVILCGFILKSMRLLIKHHEFRPTDHAHNARVDRSRYRQRAMCETVFSTIKRTLGDVRRAQFWFRGFREMVLMCVAHNINRAVKQ